MKQKEKEAVEYFIKNPDLFISEISRDLNISKSSIQRYLQKNSARVITVRGITIGEQLEINKSKGNKKGGETSFQKNDFVKAKDGTFIGCKKTKSKIDKVKRKETDIKLISTYYLQNKDLSLEDLTNLFTEVGLYSKSYVYDCLTGERTKEVLGEDTYNEIISNLSKNRPNNIDKGKK